MADQLNITRVKSYTDKQLMERVRNLSSYEKIPSNYWILGVQSHEDSYNKFDDKFYIFKGTQFISVLTGTTNAGSTGLMNYSRYNRKGVAVIKTDEWYYNIWSYGLHRGKMPALKQVKNIKYYRDWNKNQRVEEIGEMYESIIGINFHTVLYQKNLSFWRKLIGGWSVGCQVVNHVGKYYRVLNLIAGKLNKLNLFMVTENFVALDRENKDLLYEQQRTMSKYVQILGKRLELLGVTYTTNHG